MIDGDETRFSAQCWTQSRRDLLSWMEERAPSLARLYESAVNLMFVTLLPGRLCLVSHAIREIRNRLPDYLPSTTEALPKRRVEYVNRLNSLAELWESEPLPLDGSLPAAVQSLEDPRPQVSEIKISRHLYLECAELVRDHRAGREKPLESAARLFRAIAPENAALGEALKPIAVQWMKQGPWLEKWRHDPGKPQVEGSDTELLSVFEEFEQMLIAVVGRIVPTLEEIRAILEDANS